MAKKQQSGLSGLVYSTNQDFFNEHNEPEETAATLPKDKQRLNVRLDTKQRAGKTVTVIANFAGTEEDLEALGKQLKTKCGTGGSVKDGLIMVQGDYKQKIIAWLKEWGYMNTKG